MIRMNRVQFMIRLSNGTGWYRRDQWLMHSWMLKHGLIELSDRREIKLTSKGRESLKIAMAEHQAHGNRLCPQ
jgi:hypothetical protein